MPAFPYERASFVLAEGTIFGKKSACERFNVIGRTYDDWNSRLKTDEKLRRMYEDCLKEIKQEWQEDAVKALKLSLRTICQQLEFHPITRSPESVEEIEAWAKSMDSLAKIIKTVGDLTISTHVLKESEAD